MVEGEQRPDDERAVLVVPLPPARGGNGLAMRAGMLLTALAADHPVDVVVVPVSGSAAGDDWLAATARRVEVVAPSVPRTRAEVAATLGDPHRRAELLDREGLPARARLVDPGQVDVARAVLGNQPTATVVVLRSYLAPFGIRLARALGASRVVVDADDDDERLLRERGDDAEAEAHARLGRTWFSQADLVVAASPVDCEAMSARYGLPVEALPNAVASASRPIPPPGRDRILYVGNLTYSPNVDAVRDLLTEVLPAVRSRVPGATVDVVGAHDGGLVDLVDLPGVHVVGQVPDVGPWYEGADLVVVPLREGAGTRLKVLEAFAHRRPVVATPAAVAGLDVVDGRSVHLGAAAPELAAHAARLLRDPDEARRTADEAERVLRGHYLLDVVVPRARRLLAG